VWWHWVCSRFCFNGVSETKTSFSWTGATSCVSGNTCVKLNDYYSQCQPGTAGTGGQVATTLATSTIPLPTSSSPAVASSGAAPQSTYTGGKTSTAPCSIDGKFKNLGKKYVGVAADQGTLSNSKNAQVIKDNFGQVTPENS
jgi:endo-1,4-beta-xylanase